MSLEIHGLKEFEAKLENMQKKIADINGKEIPLCELFDSTFMAKHSVFTSFDDFLEAGGFKVSTKEDWNAIPENELSVYVAKSTNFKDWDEMQQCAVEAYVEKVLC